MAARNQPPLFMVKDGQDAFDAELDARGYQIVDPVVILRGDIDTLAVPPEPITAFTVWPPLQIMLDIWDAGGIGPARINVMERSCDPKTSILGRTDDRAAGAGFAAIHGDAAYVHALTVAPERRRRGGGGQHDARRRMLGQGERRNHPVGPCDAGERGGAGPI